jgi:hypothetical protein
MKTINTLKSLNILEDLYNPTIEKQIEVSLSDKPYTFNVMLTDLKELPDCKISSWGANLWTRTTKGMKYEQYKTLGTLQNAIVNSIKTKIDTDGDITFSLSNVRYVF